MAEQANPKPVGRGLVAIGLVGAAILLGLLAWPIFVGGVYSADDLAYLCIPYRYYYAEALKAGDNFLWTPQLFCGFYLQGDGQAGMCHPLHWLLYRLLPLDLAFNLEFLLAYAWMFPGMALLLWRFKISWPAALLGGLIFTFCGFNIFHFMHMHAVAILANLPWLLLAADYALTSPSRRVAVAAVATVALLTASQILTCYPLYMVFSLMAEAAFVLWRFRRWAHTWRVAAIVAALLLGLAMGAVQVLPMWEALKNSSRGGGGDLSYHLTFSMHPLNLVQLWSPFAFKDGYYATSRFFDGNAHEMGLYLVSFATVALAWLWIRRRQLGAWTGLVKAAAVFGAVALILAMGKYGGLYYITSQLPVLSSLPLRCPTRHIVLVHLALAVLSAVAMADLLQVLRSGARALALAQAARGSGGAERRHVRGSGRHLERGRSGNDRRGGHRRTGSPGAPRDGSRYGLCRGGGTGHAVGRLRHRRPGGRRGRALGRHGPRLGIAPSLHPIPGP